MRFAYRRKDALSYVHAWMCMCVFVCLCICKSNWGRRLTRGLRWYWCVSWCCCRRLLIISRQRRKGGWQQQQHYECLLIYLSLSLFIFLLGIAGFLAVGAIGAYKYRHRGTMSTSVFLMQLRVAAQGTVVGCLSVGLAYQMAKEYIFDKQPKEK